MRLFFMVRADKGNGGDLLGVEIITHFASSPARPLHPEFVYLVMGQFAEAPFSCL
ncbi:hypothetical protein SEEH4316_19495, partial [Salmonella enterica subsp. enterica serovar Heidelberg str. RI-11-014316]